MKCRYSKCFHENHDISENEEFVQMGSCYYHKDCYQVKNDILEIRDLFVEKINKTAVYSQLMAVINNIIFNKGTTSEYLKFGLQYYIDHKIPLNYPQGLYYVVQNKDVKTAYDKIKADEIRNKMSDVKIDNEGTKFTFKPQKKKGFGDILC